MVKEMGTDQEKRFVVTSHCSKPRSTEGTYGECNHIVRIIPLNQSISLITGEDVVLVDVNISTIFATIQYGCCGGDDIVQFYTEKGEYLGHINGFNMSVRSNSNNAITRIYDFKNVTSFDGKLYFIMLSESSNNAYHAIVFEKERWRTIPVEAVIMNKKDCDTWYVDKFTAYGDRKDILLEIQGNFCTDNTGPDRVVFSCLPSGNSLKCEVLK